MKNIVFKIYTTKDISTEIIARSVLTKLEELNIEPDLISFTEPIKNPYSLDKGIEHWTNQEDGCYDAELSMNTGKAGSFLAKKSKIKLFYSVMWWKCANKKNINILSFWIPYKYFTAHKDTLTKFFEYAVDTFDAVYGNITLEIAERRQYSPGKLSQRLPGIFWCNYFSKIYIDFFTKEKLLSYNWVKVSENNKNGMYLYLSDDPIEKIEKDESLELKAKKYLGEDSFADGRGLISSVSGFEELQKTINKPIDQKNVPDILK